MGYKVQNPSNLKYNMPLPKLSVTTLRSVIFNMLYLAKCKVTPHFTLFNYRESTYSTVKPWYNTTHSLHS